MRAAGRMVVVVMAGLALVSCATVPGQSAPAGESPLLTSLQVTAASDIVSFLLQVTNTSDEAVELNFSSGQSFDVAVSLGEDPIWRWSDGQTFTQATREDVLEPGESRSYEAQWRPPDGVMGDLVAVGVLAATDHRVEQAVRFSLP